MLAGLAALALWLWPGPPADTLTDEELRLLLEAQQTTEARQPRPAAASGVTMMSEPATLIVQSVPSGAAVLLDRKPAGYTPLEVGALPSGYHTLTLQLDDRGAFDTLVYAAPGQTLRLTLPLKRVDPDGPARQPRARAATPPAPAAPPEPAPPSLHVFSEPPAEVLIDGGWAGTTPLHLQSFSTGAHAVTVRAPGYRDATFDVEARPGQAVQLRAALEPVAAESGRLAVRVIPWGTVYVDGTPHARDTDLRTVAELPPGPHTLRVVHPQLGTQEQTVTIEAGRMLEVVIDLNQPPR